MKSEQHPRKPITLGGGGWAGSSGGESVSTRAHLIEELRQTLAGTRA